MLSARRFAKLALVTAAILVMFPITSAQAATHDLEFVNTGGSFTIGSMTIDVPIPGGGLVGTWDDVTGDFTGATEFNPITIPASDTVPVEVVVNVLANGAENVTGTIDPATGEANLTASVQLSIEIAALTATCTTPAFDVIFDTVPPGEPLSPLPFDDASEYLMTLDGVMTVPAMDGTSGCALNDVVNATLGLPAEGGAILPLIRGTVPPPPPTTPTTQGTTSTTGGTAPAAATTPRFTG